MKARSIRAGSNPARSRGAVIVIVRVIVFVIVKVIVIVVLYHIVAAYYGNFRCVSSRLSS